jgi:hypothetical protein
LDCDESWSRIEHRLSSSVSLLAGTITRKGLRPAEETDDAHAGDIDARF